MRNDEIHVLDKWVIKEDIKLVVFLILGLLFDSFFFYYFPVYV